MKLRIAIVAVMVLFTAGLYLYLNPVEKEQPLFRKSESNTVEKSVVPDDSDNSDRDDIPTQQEPKHPEKVEPKHFHTIVVLLGNHLPTAGS
ncbi:hypothetical protein C6502_06965 [Candidatus Poribacteria bacterium]|nr:MAG: hypothetical protein C6502_06965 [Candidatus Poribacteria bacterium]